LLRNGPLAPVPPVRVLCRARHPLPPILPTPGLCRGRWPGGRPLRPGAARDDLAAARRAESGPCPRAAACR